MNVCKLFVTSGCLMLFILMLCATLTVNISNINRLHYVYIYILN